MKALLIASMLLATTAAHAQFQYEPKHRSCTTDSDCRLAVAEQYLVCDASYNKKSPAMEAIRKENPGLRAAMQKAFFMTSCLGTAE